jgi:hypothetical protein
MIVPSPDNRSPERKALDERIAAESPKPPIELPPGAVGKPLEAFLATRTKPIAVAGIVENGVVRPLDPSVHLPEHARVIIVATEGTR